jgi:hypothetical protein
MQLQAISETTEHSLARLREREGVRVVFAASNAPSP